MAAIDRTDYRPWSPVVVTSDPDPEIATNEEWRGIMIQARKDQELSQAQLGARVGTSQNMISLIEAGPKDGVGVGSSKFVMPICRILKIPPPVHFESEDEKAWLHLGHVLRTKNMKKFRRAMALIESMVEDENEQAEAPANDERARKH